MLVVAGSLLFGGCSVTQQTDLLSDGGAEADVRVELSDILVGYLRDLSLAFSPGTAFSVFDLEILRANLEAEPGVNVLDAREDPLGTLHLTLSIASLSELEESASPAVAAIIDVEESPAGTAFEVTLGPREVVDLLDFAGAADATALSVFLPGDTRVVSEEQYIDDATWVLEEYAPPWEIESAIRCSGVEVVVRPPTEILSVEGGAEETGSEARFEVSILELVTLSESRRYTVVYR